MKIHASEFLDFSQIPLKTIIEYREQKYVKVAENILVIYDLKFFDEDPPICGEWEPNSLLWKANGKQSFKMINARDNEGGSGLIKKDYFCVTENKNRSTCLIILEDRVGNKTMCESLPNKIDDYPPEIEFEKCGDENKCEKIPKEVLEITDYQAGLHYIGYHWSKEESLPAGMNANFCRGGTTVNFKAERRAKIEAEIGKPTSPGEYYLHVCAMDKVARVVQKSEKYILD